MRMKEPVPPVCGCSADAEGPATIRTLYLITLLNVLAEVGSRVDPLLREFGFHRMQATTPYERVALGRYVALLEQAAERFDRPFLGLDMGARFGLEELGPFHALFRAAGNLREVLDCFLKFQRRWQTHTLLELARGPETSTLSYRIQDPGIWPRRQDAEFTMAGFVLLTKQLARPRWSPVQVHFEHSIVGREKSLARFFGAPVLGNQAANQVVMFNQDLERPFYCATGGQDQRLHSVLECHLLALLGPEGAASQDIATQANEIIARRLGRGAVDCDSIAAALDLSSRSLRRRLAEEGTCFRNLLQEARQARAQALLQSLDLPLSAVAQGLGYSDQATFSRAFKEWTAVSPRRYSKSQG